MNCPISKVIAFVVVLFSFAFLPLAKVSADYTSISISPSSGVIYGDSTAVTVSVNSGSDEFYGVDVNLAFTGPVEYISSSGAARCNSFLVTPGSATLNIECLSTGHSEGETYNGVIATLYFRATGTGSSTFSFTSTDPNITTKTGSSYTLSLSSNPNKTNLPDSGIFDDSRNILLLGVSMIILGVFYTQFSTTIQSSLSSFIGRMKSETREKRRDNLEKKF